MSLVKRVLMAGAVVLVLWAPSVALACPACAGNTDGGVGRIVALGAMILFPFVVVAFVIRTIRNTIPGHQAQPLPGVESGVES